VSVRAGIEPLARLNAFWPSTELIVVSQDFVAASCGAPTVSVN